jgi:hypothetical protein
MACGRSMCSMDCCPSSRRGDTTFGRSVTLRRGARMCAPRPTGSVSGPRYLRSRARVCALEASQGCSTDLRMTPISPRASGS